MEITCWGAAGCVTGSCFLIDNGKKYLVDCGLFQGGKKMEKMNRQPWMFDPKDVNALFLTHAHIDHSGRIPKLVKDGFQGRIFATRPTIELCKILLLDSAYIQTSEAEWQSRKNRRRGKPEVQPLYTEADVEECLELFEPIQEGQTLDIDSHCRVRFRNAGHILGSSILEFWNTLPEDAGKVVFSGDLGRKHQLIVRDPESIFNADALFMESTYGNRDHRSFEESKQELLDAIHYSYEHKEKILIPAFAVERTQEILYVLGEFFRADLIPSIPVYLDSPLAIAATEVFRRMKGFYDEEAKDILREGYDPFDFPQLIFSRTTEESIKINETPGPAIIIAGNGMCTAGRIKHHLKHNLWRNGCSLVIVGFQAAESIGRRIVEGARTVKIFGERIAVRARVHTIGGFSAHAGQSELLEWISHFKNPQMSVFVVHGEQEVSEVFARLVREKLGFKTSVPTLGELITVWEAKSELPERPGWERELSQIVQMTKEIEQTWRSSYRALDPQQAEELAKELSAARAQLAKILKVSRSIMDS